MQEDVYQVSEDDLHQWNVLITILLMYLNLYKGLLDFFPS